MAEMPVIVMTGETDQKAEQNALEAGAWDFVTKPYNPRVLKSRGFAMLLHEGRYLYMKKCRKWRRMTH